LISPAPSTSTATPPILALGSGQSHQWYFEFAARGRRISPAMRNLAFACTGSMKDDFQFTPVRVPVGDHRARNLIDGELIGQLHLNLLGQTLQDLELNFGIDLGRIFAESHQFGYTAA
jgi:hypothetical protein